MTENHAKRLCITGGAGFIGSAACRRFVSEGWSVLNIDKLTYAGNLSSLADVARQSNYRFEQVDIVDRAALTRLLAAFRPNAILHLAAETHVDRSITGSDIFIETNVVGTHILLSVARDYWEELDEADRANFRFVHVSTDEVFGALGSDGAFTEQSAYVPRSPYAASKAASDHLVRAFAVTYGLPVLVANCSNNYGPYQFPEKLIPLTILNALEGKAISVYGDGGHVRDWLHVDDHIAALKKMLEGAPAGETYVIGGGNERSNLDVVHAICDAVERLGLGGPRRNLIRFVEDRPGHDRRYATDSAKLRRELSWQAVTPFDAGLQATVRWFLENAEWWRPIRDRYAGERLGLAGRG